MALSNVLSESTKTAPLSGELSTTKKDVDDLYTWEFGDAEPEGTHAKNFGPMKRYRQDLRKGAFDSKRYKHNVIWVNTFKPVSEQLANLK